MGRLIDYFNHKYPYSDFHELNADWIIAEVKELVEIMDNFIHNETITFADPITWNITTQYSKNTVVIDSGGNAYLSKTVVPEGIQLNNSLYWLEIFNFTNYTRTANQNLTFNTETNTTRATNSYSVDDWLIWNDVLYKVTSAIAIDDTLIASPDAGANLEHFTVEDFIKAFMTWAINAINQYKNEIDASELQYQSAMQAEVDRILAGATEDSEVIDAREASSGVDYTTLGSAIRTAQKDAYAQSDSAFIGSRVVKIDTGIKQGSWNQSTPATQANRIGIDHIIAATAGSVITLYNPTLDCLITGLTSRTSTGNNAFSSGWLLAGATEKQITVPTDCWLVFGFRMSDNSNITPADYDGYVYMKSKIQIRLEELDYNDGVLTVNRNLIESGKWVYSEKHADNKRLRCKNLIPIKKAQVVYITPGTDNNVRIVFMEDDEAVTGIQFMTSNYTGEHMAFVAPYDGVFSINVSLTDATQNLTIFNYDSVIQVYDNIGKIPGKNVHIYHFGGKGNDWCFVRTPEGYDPNRPKPYNFVICNHGNGWVMDGTINKANWTSKTMYLSPTDPEYIAHPDYYYATNDSSLWYSNPTIEKFLSEDYIVCGCENYGDQTYGNDNCRQACAEFYDHMVKCYNVPDYCFMIGHSAGGLTTLNAQYLLGEKVRAMILTCPITCLVESLISDSNHRAGIRTAYGLSVGNREYYIENTRTHDLMNTQMADNKKVSYFPPVTFYYSLEDTSVDAAYNSILANTMLNNSLLVSDAIEVTGDHGSKEHFNPDAYFNFLNKYSG